MIFAYLQKKKDKLTNDVDRGILHKNGSLWRYFLIPS